jgi:hypothetical protein
VTCCGDGSGVEVAGNRAPAAFLNNLGLLYLDDHDGPRALDMFDKALQALREDRMRTGK